MIRKVKQHIEKFRNVKNNDKSKFFMSRGARNARYNGRILSKKKNTTNLH